MATPMLAALMCHLGDRHVDDSELSRARFVLLTELPHLFYHFFFFSILIAFFF
jgi:hypothetical protein